jgi:predicted NUDIX family NTP pyrophosphohydrolase
LAAALLTPLSAGVLLHRLREGRREVLLIHPGGPYWARRGEGAWQIPKGGVEPGEELAAAAAREFTEELGSPPPLPLEWLCRIRQRGGKQVEAFIAEGDLDEKAIVSIRFEMEWPPRSGRMRSYPEVDEARWFDLAEARHWMLQSQVPILDAFDQRVGAIAL